jgi:oligoendopeptidase F
MGVSLVDMEVWKWLYQNPSATPADLKEKVIQTAKKVWNTYYAPVFGISDEPILAIYSHMISYPLYLSAYPLGHLIEFQMEDYIGDKNLAQEIYRMLTAGSVIPEHWMKLAVGTGLSIQPMLKAVDLAVEKLN